MSQNTYELQVVDRLTGKVHKTLTRMYNEYLEEDVEGMNLPPQYKVELRNK